MNAKMKQYILEHWSEYDMVDSREEMLALLNILEAHGESLDSLHDVTFGNTDRVCSILFNSTPETDREVVEGIREHNVFYATHDALMEAMKELAEDCGGSVEETLEGEDVRQTSDGYVRVLWY